MGVVFEEPFDLDELLKKIEEIGRTFFGYPNDPTTRHLLRTVLDDCLSTYDLYDYHVICDVTNNTTTIIGNNQIKVGIAFKRTPNQKSETHINVTIG